MKSVSWANGSAAFISERISSRSSPSSRPYSTYPEFLLEPKSAALHRGPPAPCRTQLADDTVEVGDSIPLRGLLPGHWSFNCARLLGARPHRPFAFYFPELPHEAQAPVPPRGDHTGLFSRVAMRLARRLSMAMTGFRISRRTLTETENRSADSLQ